MVTVESIQNASTNTERVRAWLINNKFGQWILLALAPLGVTPDLFSVVDGCEKPLYAQFKAWKVVLAAATAFSGLMVSAVSDVYMAQYPNIQGLSGAEYSRAIDHFKLVNTISSWALAIVVICIYSSWWWRVHRFVVRRSERIGKPVLSVPMNYFTLMTSSMVFWAGVVGFFGVKMRNSLGLEDINAVLSYFDAHTWLMIPLVIVMFCIRNRFRKIRGKTRQQLYPNYFYEFMTPLVVVTGPLFILLVVIYIVNLFS